MAIMPCLGERVLELQGAIKTVRRGVLPLMQQRPAEPPGALQLDRAHDDSRSTGCRTPKTTRASPGPRTAKYPAPELDNRVVSGTKTSLAPTRPRSSSASSVSGGSNEDTSVSSGVRPSGGTKLEVEALVELLLDQTQVEHGLAVEVCEGPIALAMASGTTRSW